MQIDANLIILAIVGLFLTIGLSMVFTDLWKGILGRIKEWRTPEIQIVIDLAVHTHDRGLFQHCMKMLFSNTTETETRIDNVKIFDKKKRELRYIARGHTGIITTFNIRGNDSRRWSIFCHREPTGETSPVKLKVCIERIGKRKICKKFESIIVSSGAFPTGEWFFFI